MKLFFSICTLFTIMQLPLADAGGFASKLLHDKYPALEVVLDLSNDTTYFARDDVKHRQPITRIKKTMKLLYLCPPRFDWQITFTVKLGEPCLFPVKWSDEFEKVECESPVVPNIARQNTVKCGQFNQGTLHFVYHRIFNGDLVRSEMFANDYELLMNMNKNDMDNMTNAIHVYQVCFNHKTRQTYFVEYDVTSFKLHPPANPEEYGTEWYENIANFFGLQNVPQRYEKEYQSRYFEFIDSKASHHDYLMEQMLIPTVDLIENQAQKSIQTYLTVAPQWKSLQEDWSNLNELIKLKIVTKKNVAFVAQPESTRNSSGVVCGTYGELRREHFSQLNFPNQQAKPGISKYTEKDDQTTYPLFWWKFVKLSTDSGMILVMPNYPKKIPIPDTIEMFCDDQCDDEWKEVKEINERIICCKPTKKLLDTIISPNYTRSEFRTLTLSHIVSENESDTNVHHFDSPEES